MLRKGASRAGPCAPAHAVVVSHFLAPIFVLPQARPLPAHWPELDRSAVLDFRQLVLRSASPFDEEPNPTDDLQARSAAHLVAASRSYATPA